VFWGEIFKKYLKNFKIEPATKLVVGFLFFKRGQNMVNIIFNRRNIPARVLTDF